MNELTPMRVALMQEDEIDDFIDRLGLESAFNEGGILKRIWTKIVTTNFIVGKWKATQNQLELLNKIDTTKIKNEDSVVSFTEEDIKSLGEAMDVLEFSKGLPEKMLNHAQRALEIIRKIDKKIFKASDVVGKLSKLVPGKVFGVTTIMNLAVSGYRVEHFAKMYEDGAGVKDAPFPMQLKGYVGRKTIEVVDKVTGNKVRQYVGAIPASFINGFAKVNKFLFWFVIANLVLGVISTAITLIQTNRVDKFMSDEDVNYLKDFYNLLYNDLKQAYKADDGSNKGVIERLDKIINSKDKIIWNYNRKVEFTNALKEVAPQHLYSIKEAVKVMTGKMYSSTIRTTKSIVTASYKINTTFEELSKYEQMVDMLEGTMIVLTKTAEAYSTIVKQMKKF